MEFSMFKEGGHWIVRVCNHAGFLIAETGFDSEPQARDYIRRIKAGTEAPRSPM